MWMHISVDILKFLHELVCALPFSSEVMKVKWLDAL
jgi:hypothetical protein